MSTSLSKEFFQGLIRKDGSVDLMALYHKLHPHQLFPNEFEADRHFSYLRRLDKHRYIRSTQVALAVVEGVYWK